MAGTSSPSSSSLSAPPPLSRASSYSSESNVDSTNDVVTPLTASHENDQLLSRFPERSLRQRCTLSLTTTALDHHNNGSETESLTSSEDGSESNDKNDKASSSSLLGSVMGLATHAGASSFLLGPHAFSTSELRPPRSRKESNEFISDDDDDDDASSSPSVIAASSAVSSPYPHLSLEKSPPSKNNSSSLYHRVQLHSSSSLSRGSSFSDVDLESGEQQVDDMVPLMSSSKTFSPRRRQPLNQQQYPLSNNNKTPTIPTPTTNSNYAFNLRSREQVIIHFLMELCMLRTDLLFICFTTFYQFFHSAVTNVAYYQHAQLNAANRIQLKDVAFDLLPPLDGELWIISEYIMIGILGISISCIASNLILSWNAPHGRPIYSMQIIRRMGMTWIVCQTLRMISFLVTTLPGASRQCRYSLPEGLTSEDMISGPAPDEGNPA